VGCIEESSVVLSSFDDEAYDEIPLAEQLRLNEELSLELEPI